MFRRAIRRIWGYPSSARRPRAVSSPLPQAFNRIVISADNPFSRWAQRIYQNRGRFSRPLPPVSAEGEQALRIISFKKIGGTHETHSNRGTDAQSRCRRHLRATEAHNDDVFWN